MLSNRELAVLIWIAIILVILLINNKIRNSFRYVVTTFFNIKIIVPLGLLIGYVLIVIFLLIKIHFWNICLIKDTLFWFGSTAFLIFFNITKSGEKGFFKDILMDNLKLVVILEFILNLYTFSFILELLLTPCILILSMLLGVSEYQAQQDSSYSKVTKALSNIFAIIGLLAFGFSVYKSIIDYKEFLSMSNLKSLLLPLILTVLSLPFFYLLAIYMQYETIFPLLDRMFINKGKVLTNKTKLHILYSANLNLKKVMKLRRNVARIAFSDEVPEKVISDILKIPLHKRSPIQHISKLAIFNDIEKMRKLLSKNGIGDLSEWNFDDVDDFHSMTNYYSFGSDLTGMQSNIAYYLNGGELFVKKLELVLNVNNKLEDELARQKFQDVAIKTFKRLSLPISSKLIESLKSSREYVEECDDYDITIVKETSMIVSIKLIIESK